MKKGDIVTFRKKAEDDITAEKLPLERVHNIGVLLYKYNLYWRVFTQTSPRTVQDYPYELFHVSEMVKIGHDAELAEQLEEN